MIDPHEPSSQGRSFRGPAHRSPTTAETTGRHVIVFDERCSTEDMVRAVADAGIMVVHEAKGGENIGLQALDMNNAVVFPKLQAAVVSMEPERVMGISTVGKQMLTVEPERVVYAQMLEEASQAPPQTPSNSDYLRGFVEGAQRLLAGWQVREGAWAAPPPSPPRPTASASVDETAVTWGLNATGVSQYRCTGNGARIAVLDTGLDMRHPDFAGRVIQGQSFVAGDTTFQDRHGHGTHCAGTAAGTRQSSILPRYGIACDAQLFIGKVLDDSGRGTDGAILSGINWAMMNGCHVVSMSLSGRVAPGQRWSRGFELIARRALSRGTLIIAAAGNDSERDDGVVAPVGHPANCPSIMAVGAVDSSLEIAPFSNGGPAPNGGQVDLVGPGVDVHSSWILPARYNRISGTSMATPHVAGIAALIVEASNLAATGNALWRALSGAARRLPLPSTDAGVGLAHVPEPGR